MALHHRQAACNERKRKGESNLDGKRGGRRKKVKLGTRKRTTKFRAFPEKKEKGEKRRPRCPLKRRGGGLATASSFELFEKRKKRRGEGRLLHARKKGKGGKLVCVGVFFDCCLGKL